MTDFSRKLVIFGCLLLTSFCFWKAAPGLVGGADASMLPSAQAALSPAVTPPQVVTTPIQEMRPGMRIVGRNPLRLETEATIDPAPEGWRLVSVRMLKPDGSYFEAELLRPLSWISRHRAKPGAVIELNMPELHVVGAAEVLSISDCPPIDPGDGPVVLSTFKNVANNILNIYVEGETDPIGVTAGHPIWSEDRQAFVHSDQLQLGERLRSAVGRTVRITSIEIRAGPEPVYNLEVAGEHVYSVTDSGLLVHNIGCEDLSTTIDVFSSSHLVSQFDTINGLAPSSFGKGTIFQDSRLLGMWNDAMRSASTSSRANGYTRYLQALERGEGPTKKMLEEAFGAVNSRFLKAARKAGYDVAQVHHWNFPKGDFPTQIVDPRHLVPIPSRGVHEQIHRATSSTTNIWSGPIAPQHQIPIGEWSTPLAR